MAVNLFKSLFVKSSYDCQVDIFKRYDGRRPAVHDRMIPFVVYAIDGGRVIGVGSRHDHARNLHDVELEPGRVKPRYRFRGRNQHLLPLMAANLAAGPLVFDVNRADLAFDEFLDEIPDMMLAAVSGVTVGNDQRRIELNGGIFLALGRGHSNAIG